MTATSLRRTAALTTAAFPIHAALPTGTVLHLVPAGLLQAHRSTA